MTPSLLIVVPTLNSFDLLPRLVGSLQQQTWPHWRVLFIDGPSGSEHRKWLQNLCDMETRCNWDQQLSSESGIFGAMNQGFASASSVDWVLFWGSDDWAASSNVLAELMASIDGCSADSRLPDLIVCRGRYADAKTSKLGRQTVFYQSARLRSRDFRRALWLGSTPPHQATLVGPGARHHLSRYGDKFRLSADLDYFLKLSQKKNLEVQVLNLELVHMADSGVSTQQTKRRLLEVRCAYQSAFKILWVIPFVARYFRRVLSLLPIIR